MSRSLVWTMGVEPPQGFTPRDILAVLAMAMGGELGVSGDVPAWKLGDAVVLAETDDAAQVHSMLPIALDIWKLDPPAALALARTIADELNSHEGWHADPSPAALDQERNPAYN